MLLQSSLAAPVLPQATPSGEILDKVISEAGGVYVEVRRYADPDIGDFIKIYWDSVIVKNIIISDIFKDFPVIAIADENVSLGQHIASYSVEDSQGNMSFSDTVIVTITDKNPDIIYAAPLFKDAINGIITTQSIRDNQGTHIVVSSYQSENVNDIIRLYLSLYDENDVKKWSGYYEEIVQNDNIKTDIVFLANASALIEASSGKLCSYYQVSTSDSLKGISETACVNISGGAPSNELLLIVSTGSPLYDPNSFNMFPVNQGLAKGSSGDGITLTVTGNAVFRETGNSQFTTNLDENGEVRFSLYNRTAESVIVNLSRVLDPGNMVSKVCYFSDYHKGNGKINYLGYSTGAPADGITPCSVYLQAEKNNFNTSQSTITKVRVTVSGNAVIDGYNSSEADVLLSSDSTAEIDIVNKNSVQVSVQLSLPESSGSINNFVVVFTPLNL